MTNLADDSILIKYARLIEIIRDIAGTFNLDTLLHHLITAAVDLSQSQEASILLYDEQEKNLYFQAASNLKLEPTLKGIIVPSESIAGWVAQHREPLIISNVHADQRYFGEVETITQTPTGSIAAIPMIFNDHLIGVLEVINKHDGDFSSDDITILQALGAQAAVAIQNTRLFQQSDQIGELVHEIRNPLTSIGTIAYLLRRSGISEEKRIEYAEVIDREIHRLSDMTTTFLDLSRMESGRTFIKVEKFNLNNLLKECTQISSPLAEKNHIQIFLSCPDEVIEITADRLKIKQVFLNLLSNALKYNVPGGNIKISVRRDEDTAWLAFQDSGCGIPANELPMVFRKFFRSSQCENATIGTGLGLSICKQIIEAHHGKIQVASQVGVGTTFTIQIPLQVDS